MNNSTIFLVSYPRSGNTWIRHIIAEILYGKHIASLKEIDIYIPDIHKIPITDKTRIAKSHFTYMNCYSRIIYLVRNPIDIANSYYKYLNQQKIYNNDIDYFIDDFCSGKIWPGRWDKHVESWMGIRYLIKRIVHNKKRLLLKYENIISDPIGSIKNILEYIDIDLSESKVREIIKNNSKKEMIKKEQKETFSYQKKSTKFINTDQRDIIKEKHKNMIEHCFGSTMNKLGYLR